MNVASFGKTDIGKVRSVNQDSFLIDETRRLYVVADGMGGHAGGEIASSLSIEVISKYLSAQLPTLTQKSSEDEHQMQVICQILATAINNASTAIYEKALENPGLKGMGTTVTLLIILGNRACFAHVGDSRLYLLRSGFIYQLTNDHSLVSEQVRAGVISEEEAETHQLKNVITRSVGYQEEEDVDTGFLTLQADDSFLLCSDGLYGKINDIELANFLSKPDDNNLGNIINLANERGGEDNITGIFVKVNTLSYDKVDS